MAVIQNHSFRGDLLQLFRSLGLSYILSRPLTSILALHLSCLHPLFQSFWEHDLNAIASFRNLLQPISIHRLAISFVICQPTSSCSPDRE